LHKFLKYLLFLSFCLFIGECTARLVSYYMGYGFFADNKRFISPFFTGTDTPYPILSETHGTFVGNHKITYAKDPNEIRLVFIGGSTTKNHRNLENLKYSDELSKILNNHFQDQQITCLNAGVDGFSSAHSLVNLSLRIIEFEPDVIVVHHNANDRTSIQYGQVLMPDYSNKYLSDHFLGYKHRSGFNGFLLRYFKSARILFWGSKSIKSFLQNDSYNPDGVINKELGKKLFKRNLQSMIAICKQFDIIPIFLTQPNRRIHNNFSHREYNDLIIETCEEENVSVINMADKISTNGKNFIDDYHYSALGILRISKFLSPYLIQIIEKNILKNHSSN